MAVNLCFGWVHDNHTIRKSLIEKQSPHSFPILRTQHFEFDLGNLLLKATISLHHKKETIKDIDQKDHR